MIVYFIVALFCSLNILCTKIEVSKKQSVEISAGYNLITAEINSVVPKAFEEVENKVKLIEPIDINKKIFKLNLFKLKLEDFNLKKLIYRDGDVSIRTPYEQSKIYITIDEIDIEFDGNYSQKIMFAKETSKRKFSIGIQAKLSFEIDLSTSLKDIFNVKLNKFKLIHNINSAFIKGHPIISFVLKKSNIFKKLIDYILDKKISNLLNNSIEKILKEKINSGIIVKQLKDYVVKFKYNSLEYVNESLNLSCNIIFEKKQNAYEILTNKLNYFEETSSDNKNTENNVLKPIKINKPKELIIKLNNKFINDLLSVLSNEELLNLKLNSDQIPESSLIKLNTYYFKHLFPCMYKLYPNENLIFDMKVVNSPSLNIVQDNQNIILKSQVKFSFFLMKEPSKYIFGFYTNIEFKLKLLDNKDKDTSKIYIKADSYHISNLKLDVDCPGVYPELLEISINALSGSVSSLINKFVLDKGIDIPSNIKGVKLNHIDLYIVENDIVANINIDI